MSIIIPNMSTNSVGLSDALFTKVQQRVLGLLFTQADQSFYTNQIVRFVGAGTGSVQRELEKLVSAGLVLVSKSGNQKHYQANHDAPIFSELRGIVLKTVGLAGVLRHALLPLAKQIQVAFVYGSIAKGSDVAGSDIDLFLICDNLAYADVLQAVAAFEEQLGRPVNPTLYSLADFNRKKIEGSNFIVRVLEQPKIFIVGGEGDLN